VQHDAILERVKEVKNRSRRLSVPSGPWWKWKPYPDFVQLDVNAGNIQEGRDRSGWELKPNEVTEKINEMLIRCAAAQEEMTAENALIELTRRPMRISQRGLKKLERDEKERSRKHKARIEREREERKGRPPKEDPEELARIGAKPRRRDRRQKSGKEDHAPETLKLEGIQPYDSVCGWRANVFRGLTQEERREEEIRCEQLGLTKLGTDGPKFQGSEDESQGRFFLRAAAPQTEAIETEERDAEEKDTEEQTHEEEEPETEETEELEAEEGIEKQVHEAEEIRRRLIGEPPRQETPPEASPKTTMSTPAEKYEESREEEHETQKHPGEELGQEQTPEERRDWSALNDPWNRQFIWQGLEFPQLTSTDGEEIEGDEEEEEAPTPKPRETRAAEPVARREAEEKKP
jgi:hypothetical protein